MDEKSSPLDSDGAPGGGDDGVEVGGGLDGADDDGVEDGAGLDPTPSAAKTALGNLNAITHLPHRARAPTSFVE